MARVTRRRAADAHRVFFLSVGGLLTVLLLLVIANLAPQRKIGVDEAPPLPALATLLPAGSDGGSARVLEIIDVADPVFAIAYRRSAWELLLVSWDRRGGTWRSFPSVALSDPWFAYDSVSSVSAAAIGGSGSLVAVRGNAGGAYVDVVSLFSRSAAGLAPVTVSAPDGTTAVARFPVGASVMQSESFEVEDIDGDGMSEAIAARVDRTATPPAVDVRVFSWRDGGLAYDAALSEIMTLSRRTFPEPEDGSGPGTPE